MASEKPATLQKSGKAQAGGALETVKTLLVAGLIALTIRTVAFEPFNIPSGSMIPTLLIGDFLFVSKYSYGYSRFSVPFGSELPPGGRLFGSYPRRGDVVVFRNTRDVTDNWIKRVIGLPGDHIQVKAGQLYINGAEVPRVLVGDYMAESEHPPAILTKEYIESLPSSVPGGKPVKHDIIKFTDDRYSPDGDVDVNNTEEYVVPPGHLFMMGDNRENSEDSRFQNALGFVPLENLVGHAQFIFFSFDTPDLLSNHAWWEFWMWPVEVRWGRLLKEVH